ncbi:hypothetical protein ACJMK2_010008, partial [Sinanodonta woodiana]
IPPVQTGFHGATWYPNTTSVIIHSMGQNVANPAGSDSTKPEWVNEEERKRK